MFYLFVLLYLGLAHQANLVQSHLNLFINQQEVMRLLGLSAELYYVREGQVNHYALQFVVPVPSNVNHIVYSWESLAGREFPYTINISSSDLSVLPVPSLNISRKGNIPTELESFSVELKCSGIRAAEVEFTMTIEITLNRATNNLTELVFRRRKQCLEHEMNQFSTANNILLENISIPSNGTIVIVIGVVMAFMLVVILFLTAYCTRGGTKRNLNHGQPMRTTSFQRLQTQPPSAPPSIIFPPNGVPIMQPPPHESEELLHRRISELTVQRCRVRLSKLLLEGNYGRLYRATYNNTQDILVKTVAQHASQNQISLLLQEGMHLYGASHAGILSVLGVSIEDHTTPFLLYPIHHSTRNLKLFLRESEAKSLTTIQIVLMSTQLASALSHLLSHGVVHKDIATRNCVIDDQLQVKLTDNSLSRDLFPSDYHCLGDSENRPIKWMSIETLQKKQFTEASDSWSFGVLMWELHTLARQPYLEIDPFEMEQYLLDGYRLSQPANCPDELFAIMAYCWALSPLERPTFSQLQICLQDLHAQLTKYI